MFGAYIARADAVKSSKLPRNLSESRKIWMNCRKSKQSNCPIVYKAILSR